MSKKEFLEILGERLSEELPRNLVIDHLQYYENYIENELRNERSLRNIMDELGDPIMIAHTIINTETGESYQGYAEDAEFIELPKEDSVNKNDYVYENESAEKEIEYTHLHTESEEEHQARQQEQNTRVQKHGRNIGCLVAGIAIVMLLLVVFSLLGSLISVLLPIILPVAIVFLVVSFVFGRK